jgi:fibronectin-binding autotransporter adhesin
MKNFLKALAVLLCVSMIARAQIPYNAYPKVPGNLAGTELVLMNVSGNVLGLATTQQIASLAGGTVSIGFNQVQTGTNTNTLTVGTGGLLQPGGSGSILATGFAVTPTQCSSGQFATGITSRGVANCAVPAGAGNVSNVGTPTQFQTAVWTAATTIQGVGPGTLGQAYVSNGTSGVPAFTSALGGVTSVNGTPIPAVATLAAMTGTPTTNDCAKWSSATTVADAGFPCFNGTVAFGSVLSGTNTSAAMVVGTGSSLAVSGSGTIAATTAAALAASPAQCSGGQFATGVTTSGAANCGTPAGAGNVSNSGTPTQYQLAAWVSSTSVQGIGPGTAGQVLTSGGASAYPSYASTLPSVTSVNGTAIPASAGTLTTTIASGTAALGTSSIASGSCATVVTSTATGVATTDAVTWTFNADPTSTVGYQATSNGMLTIVNYPTSGIVNFKVCNNTGSAITPGAVTLNWRVVR